MLQVFEDQPDLGAGQSADFICCLHMLGMGPHGTSWCLTVMKYGRLVVPNQGATDRQEIPRCHLTETDRS